MIKLPPSHDPNTARRIHCLFYEGFPSPARASDIPKCFDIVGKHTCVMTSAEYHAYFDLYGLVQHWDNLYTWRWLTVEALTEATAKVPGGLKVIATLRDIVSEPPNSPQHFPNQQNQVQKFSPPLQCFMFCWHVSTAIPCHTNPLLARASRSCWTFKDRRRREMFGKVPHTLRCKLEGVWLGRSWNTNDWDVVYVLSACCPNKVSVKRNPRIYTLKGRIYPEGWFSYPLKGVPHTL